MSFKKIGNPVDIELIKKSSFICKKCGCQVILVPGKDSDDKGSICVQCGEVNHGV